MAIILFQTVGIQPHISTHHRQQRTKENRRKKLGVKSCNPDLDIYWDSNGNFNTPMLATAAFSKKSDFLFQDDSQSNKEDDVTTGDISGKTTWYTRPITHSLYVYSLRCTDKVLLTKLHTRWTAKVTINSSHYCIYVQDGLLL